MINIRDVLIEASGADENGKPKCGIGLFFEERVPGQEPKPIDEINFEKPILNIFRHSGFVQIDFIFERPTDMDLMNMWSFLQKYSDAQYGYNDEDKKMPWMVMSILPNKLIEEAFIICENPMFYTLQPKDPSGEPTVIRVLFQEEDFMVYENDNGAFNEIVSRSQIEEEE